MKKFFSEFKAFISKGNVFDMAVGLIIATAFNKIVSSLVNDIIMPLITWGTGAASLADLSIVLRRDAEGVATLTWAYGAFLQTVIDFLIIALSVFIMVKLVTNSQKKFKELTDFVATQSKKEIREERKLIRMQAKEQNKSFKELWKEHEKVKALQLEEKKKLEEEQRKLKEQEEKLKHPSQEELLMQIRDLLKENTELKQSKQKNKKDA